MNRIDKIIGNILGKNKTKKNGLGLNLNMKPMNLGLSKKPIGASIRLQNQWKSFSPMKKVALQKRFTDSDRDGVPNRWDCQPMNPRRQEDDDDDNDYDALTQAQAYEIISTIKKYLENKDILGPTARLYLERRQRGQSYYKLWSGYQNSGISLADKNMIMNMHPNIRIFDNNVYVYFDDDPN